MLSNSHRHPDRRLEDLCTAVKLVYASTFSAKAKAYLRATPQRPEKEKMAVIIQKLIGRPRNDFFYPSFAGVAQSYNYYPIGKQQAQHGEHRQPHEESGTFEPVERNPEVVEGDAHRRE